MRIQFFLREEESRKRNAVSFLLTFSFRKEPGVKPHGGYTYSFFLWEEESEKRKSRFFFAYFFLSAKKKVRAGVYYGEVPPVPIPNTEVKLTSAEDTWREAAWKNRSSPAPKESRNGGSFLLSVLFCPGRPGGRRTSGKKMRRLMSLWSLGKGKLQRILGMQLDESCAYQQPL